MRTLLLAMLLAAVGCQQAKSKLDEDPNKPHQGSSVGSAAGGIGSNAKVVENWIDLDSKEVLGRAMGGTGSVDVKHVLISWKDLDAKTYHGKIDKRAANRSNEDAAKLATDIATQLRANPDKIDELVKQYSEDPGSLSGEPYTVDKDTPFVPEFKNLALRLKEKEVGIVRTAFGYHVMERVAPPPPDPLESKDILDRKPETDAATIQHILISWKDKHGPDPRAKDRTKEQADKLAADVLAKARAPGADFGKLMKEFSEDGQSKDSAKAYDISADDHQIPAPIKDLSIRLKEGEVGLVKSPLGFHVIKRLPPDPLNSKDILAREVQAPKVKVKHVLLGWVDAHAEDPRGTKRTRAELEKAVKDTVDKLNKGAKVEDVMKELSEDPGSAKSGDGYDVTADSNFVPSFKALALRLKLNEVGVVKSPFGIHVMKRVE